MMVDVDDPHDPRSADAVAQAVSVLPTVDDLWGNGWERDVDSDPIGLAGSLGELDVPAGFPEGTQLADADVTFLRPRRGGMVCAVSSVFADRATAASAGAMLADEHFIRSFSESVAAAAELPDRVTLLGPVMRPIARSSDATASARHHLVSHRATWSIADQSSVLPVALDVAVVVANTVLVLIWAVDEVDVEAERGWDRLIDRVMRRCGSL